MTVAEQVRRIAVSDSLLVAVDFDGTLSPLVDEPMTARMHPDARAAVNALLDAPDTTVALVSGRSLRDLREIAEHGDDSRILLAGSHGAEYWVPGTGQLPVEDNVDQALVRDRLRAQAEHVVSDLEGAWIEAKAFGFAVHTRTATPLAAEAAEERVDRLVTEHAPTWRRRSGHSVIEYAFRHEGKDSAVARLRALTHAGTVLFAGDDVTDEDALRSLEPGDLGVHVGAGQTAATVSVPDIPAFAALLGMLARERSGQRE